MTNETRPMTTIHSADEIPAFASERDEAEFWDTHTLGDEFWENAPGLADLDPPLPFVRDEGPEATIAIIVDRDVLDRLKALARRRRTAYQMLVKQFMLERLDEEERHEGTTSDATLSEMAAKSTGA